ncbi:CYTH domain-containing protein [Solibacillus sp. FSL R7-0668]|uniref:CYTH domain-containing protein n=1 Tax=Solibacillus sp. FSL R7-0668 TaxID=2921688 RepID=UPI0030F7DA39
MSQQIEIEFKNMLTKAQYEQMLIDFAVQPSQIIRQVNHYFDTSRQHLKTKKSALRIRAFDNSIECTLKEKTSEHQHLETTDMLTQEQAEHMLAGNGIEAPHVKERLAHFDIPTNDLQHYGTLTTDRVELPYEGGLLVFDHSFYLHCDDYEVEYETNDETYGKNVFLQFLQKYNIEPQTAPKKIVRFMTALTNQKG